uniref:Uncharacterized protein n=1 Tax=Romanomermis culicivorax TaxID=13658 RepID=A0A915J4G4_ROMCU
MKDLERVTHHQMEMPPRVKRRLVEEMNKRFSTISAWIWNIDVKNGLGIDSCIFVTIFGSIRSPIELATT